MKQLFPPVALAVAATALLAGAPASAKMPQQTTKTVGEYKVEMKVLPAEPFYTQAQVDSGAAKAGMLAVGGAAPVPEDAASHPNHHVVIEVATRATGKTVTDARVTMQLRELNAHGKPTGHPIEVPVVVMQAIGKGAASTHYGNNVHLDPGRYRLTATVDGKTVRFRLRG